MKTVFWLVVSIVVVIGLVIAIASLQRGDLLQIRVRQGIGSTATYPGPTP